MVLSNILIVHFLQNITEPIMTNKYLLCGGLGLTILEAGEDVWAAPYCCCCEHKKQHFRNLSLIIPHIDCLSTQYSKWRL